MMELFLLSLVFFFGVKHTFDADHVLAVTSLSRGKPFQASMHWAVGHMLTAAVITVLLFVFKDLFLTHWLSGLEAVVAIMLIAVGLVALKDLRGFHAHTHSHGSFTHSHPHLHSSRGHDHRHVFGVGVVHGLASNDELLILLTLSIGLSSIFGLAIGLLVFGTGVLSGMALFSLLISRIQKISWGLKALVGGSGMMSVLYGSFLLIT